MATAAETKGHFSLETIRLLAERAGQRCSLCNCGTSGPHTDSTKSLIIGEAAHIEAEAARGPRPNPKKTKEEFHDAENGIWLCRNCHKRVDRDFAHFPVERLQQIKQDHEARIHREMGSRGLLVPGKIFAVPHRRNRYFTGREDVLAKLAEQLKTHGKAALGQVAAISGLGGIGKTQTAIEFAYLHREEYRAVFFVVSETEADLHGGFATIAKELKLPEADEPDLKLAVQAARRWLESEDSWLLILDNADVPELLKPFVPTTPRGHVIVTSRARNLAAIGAKVERLASPSLKDAEHFLLERTGRQFATSAERQAARDLAKELGNLPLALEQAAAYMAEREASFADYLASYNRRGIELLAQGKVEAGIHQSVAVTWSMNIDEVEKQSPASADLLQAAAFLAPDAIPDELLLDGGAEISDAIGAAVASKDQLAAADLAEPLLRYSLVERHHEARTLSVHRLVQEVVKYGLGGDSTKILLDRLVHALRAAFSQPDVATWVRCERLLPHLLTIEKVAAETVALGQLLGTAGLYLHQRARFVDAEPLFLRSLQILEKALGKEHPDVATTLNNLAILFCDQGRIDEGASLFQRSLDIRESSLGNDHLDVAACFNNLAILYRQQGKMLEVEPLYQQSLAIYEKKVGSEHPFLATCLNNLASLYKSQGKFLDAEKLHLRSLEIRKNAFGENHQDVASSLNNLATLYREQGRLDEAEPLALRSREIRENLLGEDHPDVAASFHNLAILYGLQGRHDEAAELDRRAEEVMTRHRALNPGSFPPED